MGKECLFSNKYEGLKVKVQLVREGPASEYGSRLSNSEDVAKLVGPELRRADREHFLSVLLNTKNVPIGVDEVSIGTLDHSIVCPRELFKSAILGSAAAIILVHNHPSGDPEPSAEDLELTKRMRRAGKLIGIRVLDHVIITGNEHLSFLDRGLMKDETSA
jgi:DNA repair protein RadC